MRLENKDLIKEFYETQKEKYPDLTFEQCRLIVSNQYKYLKHRMQSNSISTVRLQYLGTFLVYPRRAEAMLKNMTKLFENHKVDRNEYFETKRMIEKHVGQD